jgi:hypothetical protein
MEDKHRASPSPEASEAERVSRHEHDGAEVREVDPEKGTLGYAQGAGYPGGEQDLDAKSDTEEW